MKFFLRFIAPVLAILWLFLVYREIELGPEPGSNLDTETAVLIAAD